MNWFFVTRGEHLVSSLSCVSRMGLLLPTLLKASEDKLQLVSDPRKPLEPTDRPARVGRVRELLLRTAVAHPGFWATEGFCQVGQKWKGGGVLIYGHLSLPARAECYGGVQKPTSYLEKKKWIREASRIPEWERMAIEWSWIQCVRTNLYSQIVLLWIPALLLVNPEPVTQYFCVCFLSDNREMYLTGLF